MKKKIIFVASFAQSFLLFRLQLMQAFVAKGYDVIALAPEDEEVREILIKNSIRFIAIPMERNGTNPINDIRLVKFLFNTFRREKPDAVFSYTIKPVVYASLAAKFARVQKSYSLITGTGYIFSNHGLKSKIIGGIAQWLLKSALTCNAKVFFQNQDNLASFKESRLLRNGKPAVVINGSGVDCERFQPTPFPTTISFLMISRLLYSKGVREYVKAAQYLKKKYPNINFRLVGWIDTSPESIKQSELDEWVAKGDIEYLGKLSDVRASIANSSVYVLPSWYEGTPRTVLEAMAMGRPVITTDAPGCRQTVTPDKNGLLVPVNDVNALTHAMESFILSPEKIEPMGKIGRELAINRYDVHKVNQTILNEMNIT